MPVNIIHHWYSQEPLPVNAQADAVEVHGVKADHVDILFKDEVFEHVQDILYQSEDALNKVDKKGD